MTYYFAPMEGLTDTVYRELHHRYFGGVDYYCMPFFSPSIHRTLTKKEQRDLPPAGKVPAIPQVLTKDPEDFLWAANVCRDLGYDRLDLNLGCPSGTVTAKGRGSGMLRDTDALDAFLWEIFNRTPISVSVKTRLGFQDLEEFPELLRIYNRYPIKLLTVHPRLREDYYKHPIRMEGFEYALQNSRNPLCYNGNLCTPQDIRNFSEQHPQVDSLMIGRGLIGDPGMLRGSDPVTLEKFLEELLDTYTEAFGSARNAMFRMKENWRYILAHFEGSEKLGKKLKKTTDVSEFKLLSHEIFTTLPFRKTLSPDW